MDLGKTLELCLIKEREIIICGRDLISQKNCFCLLSYQHEKFRKFQLKFKKLTLVPLFVELKLVFLDTLFRQYNPNPELAVLPLSTMYNT